MIESYKTKRKISEWRTKGNNRSGKSHAERRKNLQYCETEEVAK
jgi:hypothetical protein